MERKIMSLGRSSLVISLPKHWVKLNELKKSDVVSLAIQRDRSLVVFPSAEKKKELEEITLYVDPNEKGASIVRRIIGCYLNGYSSIRLTSKKMLSVTQQNAIREIAGKIYTRIMESDTKNSHLTTLIDESKASITSAINRMYLISHSMCQDALNSLKDHDADLAKAVYSLDDDVDHFFFFLLRLLRSAIIDPTLQKQLDLDPIDCLNYQMIIHRIEHVADNAANIAKNVIMLQGRNLSIPEPILLMVVNTCHEALHNQRRLGPFSSPLSNTCS